MKERKKTWKEKVKIVEGSYLRAKGSPFFAKLFYENLFYLKPKIKDYFHKTDIEHQEKAIIMGMDFMIAFLDKKNKNARDQILRLSRSHSMHGMKIHPHDYYYWIEALILTASETDHLWQKDFPYYWRECINYPITFMISQYFLNDDDN